MDTRIKHQTELLTNYYGNYDEDGRLANKCNSVEFLTTMRYIEKYLSSGVKVLEVGAGTGRYSRAIADKGFDVEAVELVQQHIDIFQKQITPTQNIRVQQGNALDLHMFNNNLFDITLILGPMYHLYTTEDKRQCISEALRVTKPGGVVFVAYVIADAAIIEDRFVRGLWKIEDELDNGRINPQTFDVRSTPEDIFALTRKENIDCLMSGFSVNRLHYVATNMLSRILRNDIMAMDDDTFELYLRYHYAVCERPDMVGVTAHSLDIFRKL
ncbi:MAG: class I SAM-dependent methyltransferase [Defluviitaleaceae bacterium]|nr:class I SAM-dependent methyltransferase [Defluviitaleaceae bacterium]